MELLEFLADLNRRDGVTVVAVLHDLAAAAAFFPDIMVLHRGQVAACGSGDAAPDPGNHGFGVRGAGPAGNRRHRRHLAVAPQDIMHNNPSQGGPVLPFYTVSNTIYGFIKACNPER